MADANEQEFGNAASKVRFQDDIGQIKNKEGEAVLEVNNDQQIFLSKSSPQVYIDKFIDDDSMGTASATSLATSESIKAYVDAAGGGSGSFDDITVDTNTLVANITGYTDKVGVATATPRRTLDVLDASNPQLRVSQADDSVYADVQTKSTGGVHITPTGGTYTGHTFLKSATASSYLVITNSTTGNPDDRSKGLTVGAGGDIAYIWQKSSNGSLGQLKIGVDGSNAITIDAGNNTTAVENLSANGNVTIGDADTDAHTLNGTLNLNAAPADLTCSGTTASFVAGETVSRGDVVYYKPADSRMWKADANATATARAVAIAAEDITGDATGRYLLRGFIKDTVTFPTYTAGDVIYTSGTAGPPTDTAPSGTGDSVQVIGWAVDGDTVYFDPGSTIVEIA